MVCRRAADGCEFERCPGLSCPSVAQPVVRPGAGHHSIYRRTISSRVPEASGLKPLPVPTLDHLRTGTPSPGMCRHQDEWSVSARPLHRPLVCARTAGSPIPSRVASTGPTRPAACGRRTPRLGGEHRVKTRILGRRAATSTAGSAAAASCGRASSLPPRRPSGGNVEKLVGSLFCSTGVTAVERPGAIHVL